MFNYKVVDNLLGDLYSDVSPILYTTLRRLPRYLESMPRNLREWVIFKEDLRLLKEVVLDHWRVSHYPEEDRTVVDYPPQKVRTYLAYLLKVYEEHRVYPSLLMIFQPFKLYYHLLVGRTMDYLRYCLSLHPDSEIYDRISTEEIFADQ